MLRLLLVLSFSFGIFSEARYLGCSTSLALSTVIIGEEDRSSIVGPPRPRSSTAGGHGYVNIETPPNYLHPVAVKRNSNSSTLRALRNESRILFLLARKDFMRGLLAATGIKKIKKYVPDIYAYSEHGLDSGELHMEVLPGKTFYETHTYAMTAKDFSEKTRAFLGQVKSILEGLEWIHSKGVLHLDIKGTNIMVNESANDVRIFDFGTALEYKKKNAKDDFLAATPDFAAPEVRGLIREYRANNNSALYSDEALSPLSDTYSVGVLLNDWIDGQLNSNFPGGLTREMKGLLLVLKSNVASQMLAFSQSNRMGAAAARKEIDRILMDPQLAK